MKHIGDGLRNKVDKMPPTRGHDLKLPRREKFDRLKGMPPTRGHDLKRINAVQTLEFMRCPPHGGTT